MFRCTATFFSPKEAKQLLRLGIPVFIAQISGVGMTFVDTVMTGQASAMDMAAVAIACSVWHPISLFGIGVLLAISPITAQLVGEKQEHTAPHVMRQGLWCALLLCIPLMLTFYVLSHCMESFGLDAEMALLSGGYLRAVLWGLPTQFLFICVRGLVEGFSQTRPAMFISIFALVLNIPLNYILIYGKLGLPALGTVGCGVATAVCFAFMGISMTVYAYRAKMFAHIQPIFSYKAIPIQPFFDTKTIRRIFRIGLPSAFAMLFEVSLFAVSSLILAPLGTTQVAGHQIALTISNVLFMFNLSLGITSTIRVGHYLGAGQYIHARFTAWTALSMTLCIACLLSLLVFFFREEITLLFSTEAPVLHLAAVLIVYVASFQIVDGLQVVSIGVLRGYNDTRIISVISFISCWFIGLPLGIILSRTHWLGEPMGAVGFWWAFIAALCCSAFLCMWRIASLHTLAGSKVREKIHA